MEATLLECVYNQVARNDGPRLKPCHGTAGKLTIVRIVFEIEFGMAHDCGKVGLATPSICLHCEVHPMRNSRQQNE